MELHFVLVRPKRAENVGAVARALKTMGFSALHIVDSTVHREEKAGWVAHGAHDVLEGIVHHASLASVLELLDLVIATTARPRNRFERLLSPRECVAAVEAKAESIARVGILFGREENGLGTEELASADIVSAVPLAVSNPSLNLSHAVMIYAYEFSPLGRVDSDNTAPEGEPAATSVGPYTALQRRIMGLLDALEASEREVFAPWIQQGLAMLSDRDIRLLHLLCRFVEAKLDPPAPT